MKSRLTLAVVGWMLLTLLNPGIITAQSRNIGTNRQPRTCGARMAPTSGAIGAKQATIYATCDRESGGYQNNFSTQFMDISNVRVSKPRPVSGNDSRIFNNIDTSKPAYDLQGSVVHYMCHTIGGGHPAGHNCTVSRVPESVGVCVQDTFSKWSCNMSYYTPKPEYQMPPPQSTRLGQATLVSTAYAQPKSFAQWCQQKSSFPAATRHTIDVLLKQAGTNNCQQADSKLRSLTKLNLGSKQISDLKPLSALTNLKDLLLDSNQISDVKPLSGLTNLTSLFLFKNQISDVKPLAGLTNLTGLNLDSNQISDINPLSGLTNLAVLGLDSNQISDVKPLSGLTNLEVLYLGSNRISDVNPLAALTNLGNLSLSSNRISDVKPLAGLTNLTGLVLVSNQISDIKPLAGLTKLTMLFLKSNPISAKVCPVEASVCTF